MRDVGVNRPRYLSTTLISARRTPLGTDLNLDVDDVDEGAVHLFFQLSEYKGSAAFRNSPDSRWNLTMGNLLAGPNFEHQFDLGILGKMERASFYKRALDADIAKPTLS